MAKWKKLPKNAKLVKGDQVWYGNQNFGFYQSMQKMHISMKKGEGRTVVPYGCRKGQMMVGLWNPHVSGKSLEANVFISKNRIKKVMRVVK